MCVSSGNWQLLKINRAKLLAGMYLHAAGGTGEHKRVRHRCQSVCTFHIDVCSAAIMVLAGVFVMEPRLLLGIPGGEKH